MEGVVGEPMSLGCIETADAFPQGLGGFALRV